MAGPFRIFLSILGIALVALPLSIVTTFFLFPFWSWFEETTGIESVGHSGPAEWCYVALFLAYIVAVVLLVIRRRGRQGRTNAT